MRVVGEIRRVMCYQNKVWRHQVKTMKSDTAINILTSND